MKASSLESAVSFYLESRRRLGFALRAEGALLNNLLDYAQAHHHTGALTTVLALRWAQQLPPGSLQRARRLQAARHFAVFWALFDPQTQIPPAGLFGSTYRRVPVHIYTAEETASLLTAARELPPPQSLRTLTMATLFGLLACTGLRISEALSLQLEDWEPIQGALTIRQTKFGQSRCLPLSPSARTALGTYLDSRRQIRGKTSALFLNQRLEPLRYWQVAETFAALRRQLGWADKQPRPRLHDLRHTFAVGCLLRWYRKGQAELNSKILSLAVYLGHRDIQHTYWYLSAVPELLALGCARWAKALASKKGGAYE